MTEIEPILNDAMALLNIYDADLLRHNDDECRHQSSFKFKSLMTPPLGTIRPKKQYTVIMLY